MNGVLECKEIVTYTRTMLLVTYLRVFARASLYIVIKNIDY